MATNDLRAALSSLVDQHGFRNVSRLLGKMDPANGGARGAGRRIAGERGRPRDAGASRLRGPLSAVDYVQRLDLGTEQAHVMERAAKAFDARTFLPTLGDLRVFCEAYGIEEPRAGSRIGRVPRIFRFLVTMDPPELARILDDQMFAGPARVAPIADAILDRAGELQQAKPGRG